MGYNYDGDIEDTPSSTGRYDYDRADLALAEAALKLGVATDKQRLAFLFFTDPDFARVVSDKVWAASQKNGRTT